MQVIQPEDIRAPAVAGKFYPSDALELRHTVDGLLQDAPTLSDKKLIAAIVPHAGYMYSGGVAAHVFKTLQTCSPPRSHTPSPTVVVISPSHRERFPYISIFSGRAYRTPLGDVPIAKDFAEALSDRDENFATIWDGHGSEHALEVELPFLQVIWPEVRLVPVVMGEQSWQFCQLLGEHLASLAERFPMFLLASSDLSHYHSYDDAVEIDRRFISHLKNFDPETLYEALENDVCEACGGGPVVATMIAAKALGAEKVDVLCYQNSGDISGERSMVVGYLAATFDAL
jgi:hypothetical protein